MHPKQICNDFASLGSPIVLEGDDLFIENPENIYPELEQIAATYKKRIVDYLKGEYSSIDHAVKQTMDKIITFYLGIEQDMNEKINSWLNEDKEALEMVMQLFVEYAKCGWDNVRDPVANFENEITDKLSKEIFDKAMAYFKRGAR